MFISPEKITNAASLSAAAAFLTQWPNGTEVTEEVCELMAEHNIPLPVNILGPLGSHAFFKRQEAMGPLYESEMRPHKHLRDGILKRIKLQIEEMFAEQRKQADEDYERDVAPINARYHNDLAMAFLDVVRAVDAGVIDNSVLSLSSMTRRDREQMKKEALLAMIEGKESP